MTHRTLGKLTHWRLGPVHAHVGLEITFCSETSVANFAFKWSLASMNSVVHLQGRLARQYTVTKDALVGVGQFTLVTLYQLLQLGNLTALVNLYQRLPGIVIAAWSRKKVVVNVWIFGRVNTGRHDGTVVRG